MISYTKDIFVASYFHCRLTANEVSLLPIDHARAFPLSFDIESRKIVSGDLNFYNQPFYANFKKDGFIDPSKCNIIKGAKNSGELIVYNVLDNCFGHAFLKLLMGIEQNSRSKEDGLLIVPSSLAHFVKKGVFAHTVEVDLNYKEFESCQVLNKLLDVFLDMSYSIQLFPIHTYGVFDKDLLFSALEVPKPQFDRDKRRICFYYRRDSMRMWGSNQKDRIIQLFSELKNFFSDSIRYTVIGAKDSLIFPLWIDDKRVSFFSTENDAIENKLLSESLIIIGVTGSHMLMPSLLSTMTVHLHPIHKYKNMAEDVVNCVQDKGQLRSYQHLYYFGNANCSDIKAYDLAYKILLHFQGLTEKTYKIEKSVVKGQREWIKEQYPYLKYTELNNYRSIINNKKDLPTRILSKIRSVLRSQE